MMATSSTFGPSLVFIDTTDFVYNQLTSVVTITNLSASSTVISGSNTINPLSVIGNNNSYCEIINQNVYTGTNSSTDIVATSDVGTDYSYYVDLGINSSQYSQNIVGTSCDSYLYSTGSNSSSFYIGQIDSTGSVYLFAGEQ